MRRTIGIALAVAVVAGVVTAPAVNANKRRRAPRKVESTYTEPAFGAAGLGLCFQGTSCVFVDPLPGEKFVRVQIEDALGLPVPASVIQDTNGDGSYLATDDDTTHICGETEEPLRIEPSTVTVWIWRIGIPNPCPGTGTSGTVTTTFSAK